MKKSLRIVFFGNEKIATGVESEPLVFKALVDQGYDVAALVIHASETTSRNRKHEPIVHEAEKHGIPVLNLHKLGDEIETLKDFRGDIGVLIAYGKIIPASVIDIFPRGIINIHPSLLPSYRGSTPVETAILDGLPATGVSVMQLAPEMDAGPVYAQKKLTIPMSISKQELSGMLHELGRDMIVKVLDGIEDLEPEQQNHSKATFCGQIEKKDGLLDFTKSAEMLEREIRAYAGWPKSSCTMFGLDITVHEAKVVSGWGSLPGTIRVDFGTKQIAVQCNKSGLSIETLQPSGKKTMDAAAFLNGYKQLVLNSEGAEIF